MSDLDSARPASPAGPRLAVSQGPGDHRERHRAAVRGQRAGRTLERLRPPRCAACCRSPRSWPSPASARCWSSSRAASTCRWPAASPWRSCSSPTSPTGTTASWSPAILLAVVFALGAGAAQRLPRRRPPAQPDHRDARHQRPAVRREPGDLRRPAADHHRRCSARSPAAPTAGIPNAVFFALGGAAAGGRAGAADGRRPAVRGDRRQPAGRPGRRPAGARPPGLGVRLRAAALLPGRRHARRHHRPAAAPSRATASCSSRVAVVVLGGHVAARRPGLPAGHRGGGGLPPAARAVRRRARASPRPSRPSSRPSRSRSASPSTPSTGQALLPGAPACRRPAPA